MGQSSNDTFPAAMHIAGAVAIKQRADPRARAAGRRAGEEGRGVGRDRQDRPHAPDGRHADPRRPGVRRLRGPGPLRRRSAAGRALARLEENMPIGGTAVGTGINTHPEFAKQGVRRAVEEARRQLPGGRQPLRSAGGQGFVRRRPRRAEDDRRVAHRRSPTTSAGSAAARAAALFELLLPETQPGSSIMPGKVNPVICRVDDPGRLPRDRQRRGRHDRGPGRRRLAVRAERGDAGDDRRVHGVGEAAGQRRRTCSSTSCSRAWC